jgi:hypothetical protein
LAARGSVVQHGSVSFAATGAVIASARLAAGAASMVANAVAMVDPSVIGCGEVRFGVGSTVADRLR